MIVEKARIALEKLQRTNYKQMPDFGLDDTTEQLISIIANECKSTIIEENKIRRYESDIIRENIDAIIRQLVLNGSYIPKETMNRIMHFNGRVIGVNSDINIYKGIVETEDGSMQKTATIGDSIININKLESSLIDKINEEIYKNFSRQLILKNLGEFPKQNRFSIFKEKLLHGRENREFLTQKYIKLLKEHTNYSDEIIRSTVEYNLDYMYDENFKKELLRSIKEGQSIVTLDEKGRDFDKLLNTVTSETKEIMGVMPDINEIHSDISQIYSDAEAYLIGCSKDITKLTPMQIEQAIKEINSVSLDGTLKQYLGDSGYKIVNNEIIGNNVKLLDKKYVEDGMRRLSENIYELVQNGSTMDKEKYLKRAVGLHYRFLRIHPFPNSNGRTARAMLNMITIPKGILLNFPKDKKNEYNMCLNETHMEMDAKDYLQAIQENSTELTNIEGETELPLYRFVKEYGVIETEKIEQRTDTERSKENSQEIIR